MSPFLRQIILMLIQTGMAIVELLLGGGRGSEKKALVTAYVKESLQPMIDNHFVENSEPQAVDDFISWAVDNAVSAANKSTVFPHAEKKKTGTK